MALSDPRIIYETPDNGKTVYARIGTSRTKMPISDEWYNEAIEVWRSQEEQKRDYDLMTKVWGAARDDRDIADLIAQAKALYLLRNSDA